MVKLKLTLQRLWSAFCYSKLSWIAQEWVAQSINEIKLKKAFYCNTQIKDLQNHHLRVLRHSSLKTLRLQSQLPMNLHLDTSKIKFEISSKGIKFGVGSRTKFLTRVGLGHFFTAWVGSPTSAFGKFPLKIQNYSIFFPFGSKITGSRTGQPLIYCGSKVCYGRFRSGTISKKISKVFTWQPSVFSTEIVGTFPRT